MTVFWSLAVVMTLLALLFVVIPVLRKQPGEDVDQDALNAEVARTRLAELEQDLHSGRLEQDQYEAARADLERELLADLSSGTAASPQPVRGGRWGALLVALAVPAGAALLYKAIGSEAIIDLLAQNPATRPVQHASDQPSVEDMVAVLIERMQSNPDDLKGWSILARSLYVMNRYAEAVPAYRNVLRLGGGDDAGTLADFADALVATNNGRFNDEAGELLVKALQLEPANIKALWLAGHWQVEKGHAAEAVRYWEQAAQLMDPTGEDFRIIRQQIGDIRGRTDLPPDESSASVASSADSPPTSPAPAGLSVTVTLDPALRERAAPDDTVFIFARAADGPRMPLAIVRKQVRELPVTVTLDDYMAMAPGMVMSNFAELTVGARISRSGNAMPQSGDLQGMKSPVQLAQMERVDILIDTITP